jgi:hydrogenase maturation protease
MLTIIGCGNLNRSDDGVGVIVARRLIDWVNAHGMAEVAVFDAGTAGMDVMFRARGAKRLILIDACSSGAEPGAVFQVPGAELEQGHDPTYSLHDFRWDHALYAGRRIFGAEFPTDVTVFLIEAAGLGLGLELSQPVQRAAAQVVEDIIALIENHVTRTPA